MEQRTAWEIFKREVEAPFAGWNFQRLTQTGRMQEAPLTWNYASIVKALMNGIDSMLDMGTGGGELFASLQPHPARTFATEGYQPNVGLARANLAPLGIGVIEADGEDVLPFADGTFDLIINRHESYLPSELSRLLKPNGTFVTQQVGGQDNLELNRLLGAPIPPDYLHWNLAYATAQLQDAGFVILQQKEEMSFTRFYDVGAIVYYLKAIEWQIRDFTVEQYAEALLALQKKMEPIGYVDIPNHRFMILAKLGSDSVNK
ncbi:SAM-dependent methyltransferase [Brevibacillus parabrevis]|uniref:class I SAM-dependent methyltransferase n=1 Tax=Brevibacillus parabrevis TaxID=54914 RepID=UPI0007AB5D4C|nr:class I SAM-dependent methyltransferase [Brevibacillus parabrevis]KZE44603.1 SAM-dependent methyltransferase [Brevibacillus parabrevis]